ncbi:MAG TPA: site-specific integrase [Tepidisphaeraceae bacterium]|nr:site-specific integrase [Tepidisphaeraceae bacterium]
MKRERTTAAVPAYRVHKAKNLGYVRLDGRMVYLGKAGTEQSHDRYRRVVAEWLATGRVCQTAGANVEGRGATVAEVVEGFRRWARSYYVDARGRPSPGLGPLEAAAKPLCALYGSTSAASFGPVALRAVRQVMIESGLCRNVINQRVACVKRIFRWAVAEELAPPSIITALGAVDALRRGRSGARETQPVRPVHDCHVEAVLPFLPPTLRAMVRLQRLTGMRSGELCVLRTCDVDRSGSVWTYVPPDHKTAYRGHDRVVRIGPRGQAVLSPLLCPERPTAYVFSPARAQHERLDDRRRAERRAGQDVRTFKEAENGGRRYETRSYRRAISYAIRAAVKAGALDAAGGWHPHQLRHRHATEIRRARGLDAARVLLGHRSLEQTLEYAEADAVLAATIARELG